MPRGYPDYFGQSIFPKYGKTRLKTQDDDTVTNNATETVLTITGKGRIFGGWIKCLVETASNNFWVKLYIDDNIISSDQPALHRFRGIIPGVNAVVVITEYNSVSGIYTFTIGNELTFESSFRIDIYNLTGDNIYIDSDIYYTLVE